ncbi:MAG TPA: lysophospholipid acyltransferase family protein [Candidatus Binatia bacterium]|jgi:lysophospholipid acyltransferase (LPLAT)-like uncharacterized protein|nr:lysophospholipid acyltransferase family protein [Candidatus Binatia bacterium]
MNSPSPSAAHASRAKKSGGIVVPNVPRWYQRLGAWLIFASIRTVAATLRYRWNDGTGYFENPPVRKAIYCVWHNRLVLCMIAYYGYVKKHNSTHGLAAMVSASKDGAFLAAILECFKVQPVRGSSSRRGPQALLELTTWAERNYDLAITPDGPRGPRYVVHSGIMSLAQVTGLPIIPVSYYLSWKIQLKSWDRFQIPLPFARCEMMFGPPVRVPREATDADRETLRLELERRLKEISRD